MNTMVDVVLVYELILVTVTAAFVLIPTRK